MILGQLIVKINPQGSTITKENTRNEAWVLEQEIEVIDTIDSNGTMAFLVVDTKGQFRVLQFGDVLFVRYTGAFGGNSNQPENLQAILEKVHDTAYNQAIVDVKNTVDSQNVIGKEGMQRQWDRTGAKIDWTEEDGERSLNLNNPLVESGHPIPLGDTFSVGGERPPAEQVQLQAEQAQVENHAVDAAALVLSSVAPPKKTK